MKAYKKRALKNWNTGKSNKDICNRKERMFSKNELINTELISSEKESILIKEEISEDEYIRKNYLVKFNEKIRKN